MSHPLLERLRSGDAAERRAACRAAAEDPAGALLTDALAAALADAEPDVARAASDALVAIARRSGRESVTGALRAPLRGDHADARFWAARTWARLEPPGPSLLPALVGALASPARALRWEAARLLVDTGRLHPEVLPLLLGLVRGADQPHARRMATSCLRELAPDRPEAAEALVRASYDDVPAVRRAALTALAGLLDPPPAVRQRLARVRESDPDATARRIAERALAVLDATP